MAFKKGDRVNIRDPHDKNHKSGVIKIVSDETPYGVLVDGMEDMGVHKWYVDSELEASEESADSDGNKKKKPMKMGFALTAISTSPWLVQAEALETILAVVDLCVAAGERSLARDYIVKNFELEAVRTQLLDLRATDGPEVVTTIPAAGAGKSSLDTQGIYASRRKPQ